MMTEEEIDRLDAWRRSFDGRLGVPDTDRVFAALREARAENAELRTFLTAELTEAEEETALWADDDDGDEAFTEGWRRRAERYRQFLARHVVTRESAHAAGSMVGGVGV